MNDSLLEGRITQVTERPAIYYNFFRDRAKFSRHVKPNIFAGIFLSFSTIFPYLFSHFMTYS